VRGSLLHDHGDADFIGGADAGHTLPTRSAAPTDARAYAPSGSSAGVLVRDVARDAEGAASLSRAHDVDVLSYHMDQLEPQSDDALWRSAYGDETVLLGSSCAAAAVSGGAAGGTLHGGAHVGAGGACYDATAYDAKAYNTAMAYDAMAFSGATANGTCDHPGLCAPR
jgi:hypothetical protein